jgi:hypothetical protein
MVVLRHDGDFWALQLEELDLNVRLLNDEELARFLL